MKKVSVQFNLMVDEDLTHKEIKGVIEAISNGEEYYNGRYIGNVGKITSIQINDIEKGKK